MPGGETSTPAPTPTPGFVGVSSDCLDVLPSIHGEVLKVERALCATMGSPDYVRLTFATPDITFTAAMIVIVGLLVFGMIWKWIKRVVL